MKKINAQQLSIISGGCAPCGSAFINAAARASTPPGASALSQAAQHVASRAYGTKLFYDVAVFVDELLNPPGVSVDSVKFESFSNTSRYAK